MEIKDFLFSFYFCVFKSLVLSYVCCDREAKCSACVCCIICIWLWNVRL